MKGDDCLSEYILEMKDISKGFAGVKALDHVQLQVKPGEVHALMGENGAGKSTLMKILMGIYTKDSGEVIFDGKPYEVANPKEAMDTGVAMIHQELNPILDMAVYENIFVGREITKNGLVDKFVNEQDSIPKYYTKIMQNCKKQWKKCKKIDVKMRENDCNIKKCKKSNH